MGVALKTNFVVQTPSSPAAGRLGTIFFERVLASKFDETQVAVAYMTVAGIRALLVAFPLNSLRKSKWLVGLDDFITQPGALDVVLNLPGAELRVISHANKNLRFHPKVYIFGKQSSFKDGMTVIGSANLTAQGLAGNGEASAILDCETSADTAVVLSMWNELWKQGHKPTVNELATYKENYTIAKKSRLKTKAIIPTPTKGMIILASDDAQLDPAIANTCWIECGNVTLMGKELELKAEQGIFFGLNPTGEDAKYLTFQVSTKEKIQLRLKYQGNHMWRLQLTNEVPEVAVGLRPKNPDGSLGRSPHVAVFDRTEDKKTYILRFILLNSNEFNKIVRKSKQTGTYGQTSARQYGWC